MNKSSFKFTSPLFKLQTKKDWDAINKNKNLQHTYIQEKFDPIYFQEEIITNSTFEKNIDWDVCVEINIKSEKQANQEALKALSFGANSICFLNFNNHNLNDLLNKIQIDIIKINFKKTQNLNTLINDLSNIVIERYGESYLNKITGYFDIQNISKKDLQYYTQKLPKYKFICIHIQASSFKNNLEEHINNQLKKNTKNIDLKTTNLLEKIHYVFEISNQFLFEISRLRSFRILYQKKFQKNPYIQCVIKNEEKEFNYLIESTIKLVACSLSGCNEILINTAMHGELHLQQHLIAKNESYLNKVSDPLHGSYYIEKLTQSISGIPNSFETEKRNKSEQIKYWKGEEDIKLKDQYQKNDIKDNQLINYGAGEPPFLRGPYASMYCEKKWTIRQYSGFSTAEESNTFYKKNLKSGQTGLSIAFDLPTHRGYDSDNNRVFGDVGKAGVAIDTIHDMEVLLRDIDLSATSVSMTMNGAVIPIMAFFIANAEKQGVSKNKLTGTIQNDILKEFMVRNTYIYPPKHSMRIIRDIFKYTSKNMPKFNSISVSGYHMLEAGASADLELAYTLCDGLEYVRNGIKSGLKIDDFAPRLSFFWGIGMNFFTEIAKLRAARILWAEMISNFKPKNTKSLMLRSHCQTSGWSLTKQLPLNNITRTTIEALAAILGGTQSLHTNALDEAISLPTEESAKIARDTQLFLQQKTDLCNTIDPFGGSYYLETLTQEIVKKAKIHIQEIEKMGGMVRAIELGIPKLKIEKSAIKRQTKIDNSENLIIGLNCYQTNEKEHIKIREIDNKKVQKNQIKRLHKIKKERNQAKVKRCLEDIQQACYIEKDNLLELAILAAENHATLGEISHACEKVFHRYKAKTIINSGVYAMEVKNDHKFIKGQKLTEKFAKKNGRRPRIITAKLGQDGHDRGMKIIATSFADIGFDVDIAPLFQTPKEIAKQAIENDVHIVGISSLAGGHKSLIPELISELQNMNRSDILVIAGGIIPEKDYPYLKNKGVKKIFGPGTIVIEAAIDILDEILKS